MQPAAAELLDQPILERLCAVTRRQPQGVLVDALGGGCTYAELWRAAGVLAVRVAAAAPKGPIGLLLPAGAPFLAGLLACLASGRPCVPLDPQVPVERNQQLIEQTGCGLLLVDRIEAGVVAPGIGRVAVIPAFGDGEVLDEPIDRTGLDTPAIILCTSGSTGLPKAIVHSQRTILHRVAVNVDAIGIQPDDRGLGIETAASLGGVITHLAFALMGASLQIFDLQRHGLRGLLATLAEHPVSNLRAAPSVLRTIMQLPDARASLWRIRNITTYGEPLLRRDLELLRSHVATTCEIVSFYGSTESCGTVWLARPNDDFDAVRAPAGVPMHATEATIVDDDGDACAPGEPGEIVLRSRYNALGEWQDGRCVPGRLLADPNDPTIRIYHSGDLARCSADGVFVVLGRRDRMVKVNGQRVEPEEIEAALRRSPEVLQAAVMAEGRDDAVRLLAFVVLRPDALSGSVEALRLRLRNVLPAFMQPAQITAVPHLPLLPSGKIDGQSLLRNAMAT